MLWGGLRDLSSLCCLGAATSQLLRVMAPGCQDLGVMGICCMLPFSTGY